MDSSNQLRSILKASGWSQEELANRLGVSFVTLNAWVNKRAQPRKKASEAIRLLYFEVLGADSLDVAVLEEQQGRAAQLRTNVQKIVGDKAVLDKLILHLTYHTNTIEGSTMTLADTQKVLFEHEVLTNRTLTEQAEARNHQAALLWLLDQLQTSGFSISEETIRGLHLRLMNGIMTDAGQYRRHSVRIVGSRVTTSNYLKIEAMVRSLITEINQSLSAKDPIATLSTTHSTFEKIHPFSDGNGRVGRLLLLAQALQFGLVPPLIPKERRQAYYKFLEWAQMEDNPLPLQLFIAESMIFSHELLFEQ